MACSMLVRVMPVLLCVLTAHGADVAKKDSVTIAGAIIDSVLGTFPRDMAITVTVDSVSVVPDSEGFFSAKVPSSQFHFLGITSMRFSAFRRSIPESSNKKNYFITCALRASARPGKIIEKSDNALQIGGPCWTISGCVVDSKHDMAVKRDSGIAVTFDDSILPVTKNGGFFVVSCRGGFHTFRAIVPGYHEAIEQVELKQDEKQPFVTIQTTKLQNTVNRREITVSAKREPLHTTASVARTQIDRKDILQTAATLDDPTRVVQTLPGVSSTSDASSRPIVRDGEPRETRVFLDGIPLIQPYHFGGFHSMFNTFSVDNIALYKSGFPAEYHNAESALLVVDTRKPAEEPYSLALNTSLLQTDAYLGIPLFNSHVGVNASFQMSYYDFFYKRALDICSDLIYGSNSDQGVATKQLESDNDLPDYTDFSFGIEIKPSDKFKLFINEIYNTDGFKSVYRSTYGYGGDTARRDTFVDYKSYYNVLYATAHCLPSRDNVITVSGAWQKRWWDLTFPAPFSVFYDTSIYNVHLSQFNGNAQWLYAGIDNHLAGTGLQLDYNIAHYDVNVARVIYEVILDGNTNFADFWGPLTNDNGLTLTSDRFSSMDPQQMMKHMFLVYQGNNRWYNGAFFVRDEWSITPRLSADLGTRVEMSSVDRSVTVTPRASAKYSLAVNHELVGSAGLYTQNNYDISSIALSNNLKPEKVWHGSIGEESRLLPWLTQKVDFYGKYYYDLITEVIGSTTSWTQDTIYWHMFGPGYRDSIGRYSSQALSDMSTEFQYKNSVFDSRFTNQGRGYGYGLEYYLRYDPASFWNGWISLSLGKSMRQDNPGWRWYPSEYDRPVIFSLVNYYRLPRTYEVSVKYRFMSGLPYTSVAQDSAGSRIGTANDSRYSPYQRLDFKFAKGFTLGDSKGHFYIELWNAFNTPNFALTDSRTRQIIAFDANWPITMLFVGMDYQF